jgi:transcriptional regulator with XRE-family HTH domain
MSFNTAFANNFKLLRKTYKIKQEDMATLLELSGQTSITMWETGKNAPSMETLMKIANFFAISLNWLVGRSKEPYEKISVSAAEYDVKINFEKYFKSKHFKYYNIGDFGALLKEITSEKFNKLPYFISKDDYSLPVRANIVVLYRLIYIKQLKTVDKILERAIQRNPSEEIPEGYFAPVPSHAVIPDIDERWIYFINLISGKKKPYYDVKSELKKEKWKIKLPWM